MVPTSRIVRCLFAFAAVFVVATGCGTDSPGSDQNQGNDGQTNQSDVCDSVDCHEDEFCDPDTGDCVECLGDDDCDGDDVCDEDTNECAVCVEDADCGDDLVCDPSGPQCVECLEDSHCPDGVCNPEDNVCEADCCSFASDEIPTGDLDSLSGQGFDLALNADGEPVVAMLDYQSGLVHVARRDAGDWSTQQVGDVSDSNLDEIVPVRIAAGQGDELHLLVGALDDLVHIYREGESWNSDILDSLAGASGQFTGASVAAGPDGAVHLMGTKNPDAEYDFFYRRIAESGDTYTADTHTLLYSEAGITAVDMDIRSDNQPIMLLTMEGDEIQILVPADVEESTWDGGPIGGETDDFAALAIDSDDDPRAVFRALDGKEFEYWSYDGTGDDWTQWNVEAVSSQGARPWLGLDADDNPHLSFARQTEDDEITYGRRPETTWEQHPVTPVGTDGASRIAVDADAVPHVVAHTDDLQLTYFVRE